MSQHRDGKSFDCGNCNSENSVKKKEVTKYKGAALIAGQLLLVPSSVLMVAGVLAFLSAIVSGGAGAGFLALLLCSFLAATIGVPGFLLTQKRSVLFCSKCAQVRDTL